MYRLLVLGLTSHLRNFHSYGVEEIPNCNYSFSGLKFLIVILFSIQLWEHNILYKGYKLLIKIFFFFFADLDDKGHCLSNCSMESDLPSNSEDFYELEKMTITFTRSVIKLVMKRPCGDYTNSDFDIEFKCEGKFIYGKTVILLF